ncbi:hypothetical protein C8J56DRAFT_1011267 [Mycena floridula]|nr:hypothetical protein C8J56DRAFT_1011267 [Mycena floridula]
MSIVWLITGTSSGFGRELVLGALARNDLVVATVRRHDKIQDLPKSDNLRVVELDLEWSDEKIKAAVEEAVSFWGHIDVLVNNAGSGFKGLSEELGAELFRKQFQINFFSVVAVTNAVLPHMRARKSGTIVMMGSRVSWNSEFPAASLYSSSKAAVRTYSESLATEVGQFNIRLLIVEPAAFRTNTMNTHPDMLMSNPISDYDTVREIVLGHMKTTWGTFKGDPKKAMNVVLDVVKGEGVAKDRPWPLYLPLGAPCHTAIQNKATTMIKISQEWSDVTTDLDFDE